MDAAKLKNSERSTLEHFVVYLFYWVPMLAYLVTPALILWAIYGYYLLYKFLINLNMAVR